LALGIRRLQRRYHLEQHSLQEPRRAAKRERHSKMSPRKQKVVLLSSLGGHFIFYMPTLNNTRGFGHGFITMRGLLDRMQASPIQLLSACPAGMDAFISLLRRAPVSPTFLIISNSCMRQQNVHRLKMDNFTCQGSNQDPKGLESVLRRPRLARVLLVLY